MNRPDKEWSRVVQSSARMGTHFSKRGGHHSGVMTGHEVMVYTFMSGTQCQPKRRKFARSSRRFSRSSINLGRDHKTLAVQKLSRSPSPVSLRLRKVTGYAATRASLDLDLVGGEERMLDSFSRGVENCGASPSHGNANIEIEISSLESNSEVITCTALPANQSGPGSAPSGETKNNKLSFSLFYFNSRSMQSSCAPLLSTLGDGEELSMIT